MNTRKFGATAPSLAMMLAVAMVAACGGDDSTPAEVDGGNAGSATGGSAGNGGSAGSSATGGHGGTGGTAGTAGMGGSGGTGGSGGSATVDGGPDAMDGATDAKPDTSTDGSPEGASDAKEAGADVSTDGGYVDASPEAGPTSCTTDGGGYTDGGALIVPTVPAGLEAPVGSTLVARYHAEGWQIYTCKATVVVGDAGSDAGTTYAWTLKAPDAVLYDNSCAAVGTHYLGPTWKSSDGSSVVGVVQKQDTSPNANSINILLLKGTPAGGEGIFANVTAVQRLDTHLGKAPTDGCNAAYVDTETKVAYTATYYFYTGGTWPTDGGDAGDAAAE